MKKFNKNIFSFLFCMIFIFTGLLSTDFYVEIFAAFENFVTGSAGMSYRIPKLISAIEPAYENQLLYHDSLIDLNSIKENLLGTRVIIKDDSTVVKSQTESLIQPEPKISQEVINSTVSEIEKVKNIAEKNGAKFLYCLAPSKELYETPPPNIESYEIENYNNFVTSLNKSEIPYIEFSKDLKDYGIKDSEIFYYTDHHWTSRTGFIANDILCKELNKKYDFEYNKKYTDINNYDIVNYPDWFLGSKGKKTGLFFTTYGADDFEIITPKFKTDLIEEQPFKNQIRTGTFQNTVLYMENLQKDYHHSNLYATYSGGDFRLQIIKNRLNPDGKKILIVRDSFACVVTPFLSQQVKELHICDMRNFSGMVGDKINIEEYINDIKPDYVLILYTALTDSDFSKDKYNFF